MLASNNNNNNVIQLYRAGGITTFAFLLQPVKMAKTVLFPRRIYNIFL